MLGIKLYLYNSTVEIVSTFNSVIVKCELCIYTAYRKYIVKSFLQNNNSDGKKLFLIF